jgi:hypothetical protein
MTTPAETTAALVLTAARTGAPLCIPGTRDVRVPRAASRTSISVGAAPSAEMDAGTGSDPERREYARAGGGAPSERGITRRANVIERLRHLFRSLHGRRQDTP